MRFLNPDKYNYSPDNFKFYSFRYTEVDFPEAKLIMLSKEYINYVDQDRLRNELQEVYSDTEKYMSPHEILDLFFKNKLIKQCYYK